MSDFRVRKSYCRRCSHCECRRTHGRDHWSTRRAWGIAVGLVVMILSCGLCCNWSTVL